MPTVLYGVAFFGQRFPKSEASAKGLTIGQMLQEEGQDVRIRREDIEDIQPASISLMPSGYASLFTRQELADLIAFLKATRPGAQ